MDALVAKASGFIEAHHFDAEGIQQRQQALVSRYRDLQVDLARTHTHTRARINTRTRTQTHTDTQRHTHVCTRPQRVKPLLLIMLIGGSPLCSPTLPPSVSISGTNSSSQEQVGGVSEAAAVPAGCGR